MAQYTKSVIAARGEEEEKVEVLNLGVIKYLVLWPLLPCQRDVGLVLHTRGMVGGKWSLLSVICPTELSMRRGAGAWLFFPSHSLEGWGCMKG